MTFKQNGQHVLIGDVSRGVGCARVGYWSPSAPLSKYFSLQPGVDGKYGRISYARAWIEEEMTGAEFCGGTADAEASDADDNGTDDPQILE